MRDHRQILKLSVDVFLTKRLLRYAGRHSWKVTLTHDDLKTAQASCVPSAPTERNFVGFAQLLVDPRIVKKGEKL